MRVAAHHRKIAAVMLGAIVTIGWLGVASAAGNIMVGGVFVCTIAHGVDGYTPEQRAVQVRQRIANILSVERFRSNPSLYVKVVTAGPSALISVGDPAGQIPVLTVTPADAAGTGVNTFTLASQWGQKLAHGLAAAIPSSHWNLNNIRP